MSQVTNCNNGFNMAEQGIEDAGTIHLKPGGAVVGEYNHKGEQGVLDR